ncbi:unnamed protein product [Amoebophrya sp. A120]|nr:unnamed protein product [Amoebophrya sp. A120]|eukprot:GSA120T00010282001.1
MAMGAAPTGATFADLPGTSTQQQLQYQHAFANTVVGCAAAPAGAIGAGAQNYHLAQQPETAAAHHSMMLNSLAEQMYAEFVKLQNRQAEYLRIIPILSHLFNFPRLPTFKQIVLRMLAHEITEVDDFEVYFPMRSLAKVTEPMKKSSSNSSSTTSRHCYNTTPPGGAESSKTGKMNHTACVGAAPSIAAGAGHGQNHPAAEAPSRSRGEQLHPAHVRSSTSASRSTAHAKFPSVEFQWVTMRDLFAEFDTDQDGFLSVRKLGELIAKAKLRIPSFEDYDDYFLDPIIDGVCYRDFLASMLEVNFQTFELSSTHFFTFFKKLQVATGVLNSATAAASCSSGAGPHPGTALSSSSGAPSDLLGAGGATASSGVGSSSGQRKGPEHPPAAETMNTPTAGAACSSFLQQQLHHEHMLHHNAMLHGQIAHSSTTTGAAATASSNILNPYKATGNMVSSIKKNEKQKNPGNYEPKKIQKILYEIFLRFSALPTDETFSADVRMDVPVGYSTIGSGGGDSTQMASTYLENNFPLMSSAQYYQYGAYGAGAQEDCLYFPVEEREAHGNVRWQQQQKHLHHRGGHIEDQQDYQQQQQHMEDSNPEVGGAGFISAGLEFEGDLTMEDADDGAAGGDAGPRGPAARGMIEVDHNMRHLPDAAFLEKNFKQHRTAKPGATLKNKHGTAKIPLEHQLQQSREHEQQHYYQNRNAATTSTTFHKRPLQKHGTGMLGAAGASSSSLKQNYQARARKPLPGRRRITKQSLQKAGFEHVHFSKQFLHEQDNLGMDFWQFLDYLQNCKGETEFDFPSFNAGGTSETIGSAGLFRGQQPLLPSGRSGLYHIG